MADRFLPRAARALALVALALTAVACDPADLNARLADYGDTATATELNSGTKGASVVLADGRVVFLANDVYLGPLDPDGDRLSSTKVANALVVANGLDPDDPLETKLTTGTDKAWLKPQTSGHTFTLLSAVAGPDDIQIFAIERTSSGGTAGFRIIRVLQSTLLMAGTPVALASHTAGPEWGSHVLRNEYDNHWYVYGTGSTAAATYVARAPFGFLTSEPSWEYWTGSSWSTAEADAGALRDEAGAVVAQYLTPVMQDLSPTVPDDPDRIVFLGRTTGTGGNTFHLSSAGRPQGPVTVGSAAYTAPVETCGTGGTVLASSISAHPHLSDDDAHAVFSYARRCSVTNTKAAVDRPRFISLDLAGAPSTPRWRATWTSGLARTNPGYQFASGFPANRTLRQVVHTSRGGSTVRIRVNNFYGTAPLVVGAASIAISADDDGATAGVTATPTPVTFGGQASVEVPAGQVVRSDAITLPVALPSDHDVAISLSLPAGATSPSAHLSGLESSYVAAHSGGDDKVMAVSSAAFGPISTYDEVYFLAGLDVADAASGGTVVAFGDSLTDGVGTSTDAEDRWPNELHRQLAAAGTPVRHIANMGVAGRTLLPWGSTNPYNAQAAFAHEVLGQPGLRTVVVWIGINDLTRYKQGLPTPTAAQLADGLEDLVDRGHAAGIRVVLATITPMRGPTDPDLPPTEGVRQQVNTMIRNGDLGADDFVDLDAAVRNPADHSRLQAAYSFGGGLHMTVSGYAAIASAVFAERASL